jgi:N-carbamoylputrescine amidase
VKNKLVIGFSQRKVDSNKISKNLDIFIEDVKSLVAKGVNVICSQELFLSKYFCFEENTTHFDLALELTDNEIIHQLEELASGLNVVLVISLFEKRTKGLYHNTAIVIDADGLNLGEYRKMHIPDDPGFYEKYYFTPGDLGYQVFDTKYGCFGVLICWDQWFPEAARLTAMKGADVLFYPTAIGWELDDDEKVKQEQLNAWLTVQKSHAVANGVFVVSVNRVGVEEETQFWGNSFVCNPLGTLLYESPSDKEDLAVCELDLNSIEEYRRVWPFFRDRRAESYDGITEKFLK